MNAQDIEWVEDAGRLAELVEGWLTLRCIGVDTEFVRTDTYFAKPGLIQVNGDGHIALVDPLAITDLADFGALLTHRDTVKVVHSGAEDIDLLQRLTGVLPTTLFDCQIAAAHCGLGASLSYRALVQEVRGIELQKSETRSNWCRRPLSQEQCHYAAEDVRHLLALYQSLHERLTERQRLSWAEEDFAALGQDPGQPSYARIRGAGRLSPRRLYLLGELHTWREGEAAARDRPRGHIVPDNALIEIAAKSPSSREALAGIDGVSPRFVRRYAEPILEIVRQRSQPDDDKLPLPLKVPSTHRDHVEALRTFVGEKAKSLGIAPELIASRRQLETLIIGLAHGVHTPGLRTLDGWRFGLLESELVALLGRDVLPPAANPTR